MMSFLVLIKDVVGARDTRRPHSTGHPQHSANPPAMRLRSCWTAFDCVFSWPAAGRPTLNMMKWGSKVRGREWEKGISGHRKPGRARRHSAL